MRTRNCQLNWCLRVCAITVAFVLCGSFLTQQPPQHRLLAQSPSGYKVFVPFVQAAQPTSANATAETIGGDEWKRFTSVSGGYSILVPPGWEVNELERGIVQLISPSGLLEEKVWIEYLHYEMPESASLVEWAKEYHTIKGMGQAESFTPVTLAVKGSTGSSMQVFYQMTPSTLGQGYLISNGRLVLMVFTPSNDKGDIENLTRIANSVEFAPDAPLNLVKLYAPEAPPNITTIEAYYQEKHKHDRIARAVEHRIHTGETPTEILEAMSEWERREYERALVELAPIIEEMDRMRELAEELQANPPPPIDQTEYLESERRYNATLEDLQGHSNEEPPSEGEQVTVASIANRRGLPARYRTPIRVYDRVLNCGSGAHTGKESYAADIDAVTGTNVYGTTNLETVIDLRNDGAWNWGYGNYVKTRSTQWTAGAYVNYIHMYAHLNDVDVQLGAQLNTDSIIGQSGATGNTNNLAHLHFAIWTENGEHPVDLSPVKGITPNLYYPEEYEECGYNRNPDFEPIIIEANEFQSWWVPLQAPVHTWSKSTYYPNHSAEAYRAATPIDPQWGYAPLARNTWVNTPRLTYQVYFPMWASYRVWVCGMGGSPDDDSVHMGINHVEPGYPVSVAGDMTGWHSSNWVWRSVRMDGSVPWLQTNIGYNDINLYMRENGMRVDRILLHYDHGYSPETGNPATDIRCGAEGLP